MANGPTFISRLHSRTHPPTLTHPGEQPEKRAELFLMLSFALLVRVARSAKIKKSQAVIKTALKKHFYQICQVDAGLLIIFCFFVCVSYLQGRPDKCEIVLERLFF